MALDRSGSPGPLHIVHHAARRQHAYPANSLSALQACLDAGARLIEMDISPLADGDFVLLHGPSLERSTTGSGPISVHTAVEITGLRFVRQGAVTDEPVGLLRHGLELLRKHPHPVEIQLDLKPYAALSGPALSRLVAELRPVKDRVRVSSMADWALRGLRALDADLPLGFDPLLYLDAGPRTEGDLDRPPFRQGAFGYWDEHPLASQRWGETADYLAARAGALWVQAPSGAVWYMAASLLARALDDGFDWIAYLHQRGAQVAAWTLDAGQPQAVALARRLAVQGVDRIISNDAPALAQVLNLPVAY